MTSDFQQYRQFLDTAPLPVCWLSAAGDIAYCNQAFLQLVGDSPDHWNAATHLLLDHDLQWGEASSQVLCQQLRSTAATIRSADDTRISVTIDFIALDNQGGGDTEGSEALIGLMFVSRDRLQEELALRHEQLSFMVEAGNDAVHIMDVHRNIIYANEAASLQTGYTREELTSMNVDDLDPVYPRTGPEEFRRYAMEGRKRVLESEHVRKDGTKFPVEISLVFDRFNDELLIFAFIRDITDRKRSARINEELQFALQYAMDAIYLYDREGNIYFANQSASRDLGYSLEEFSHMNIRDLDDEFSELDDAEVWIRRNLMQPNSKIARHKRKDGSTFPVEIVVSASDLNDREFAVAFVRNISDRLQAQKALEDGEERFRVISDTSPVALITTEIGSGRIQYANRQVEKLFGKPREELTSMDLKTLFQEGGIGQDLVRDVLSGQPVLNREVELLGVSDSPVWLSVSTSTVELQGQTICCCAMMDITEARELANQLSYQATYDDLTGLVNRREFEDRLQEVIDIAAELQNENVLCYMDLDQFKIINDTCGHMAGDEMLRQIAQVLYGSVRQDDVLARLGGDEFAILLENCNMENAERVANKVRMSIQEYRFSWGENTFLVSASMGLVPIATQGETITEVLRRADTACYAAKDAGRNRIHISRFDDRELIMRHGEMQWVSRVNDALEQNHLELWQQRIAPAAAEVTNKEHFELLLRMRASDGTIIMPGAFLPAAERYDLAPRIDRWTINAMFDWFESHPAQVRTLGCCSINLSGQTLGDNDFLDELTSHFRRSSLKPEQICFEITETAAIANLANATYFIKTLKNLGCVFALDDFGSGLSSFAYLKNLPVDYVKIDGFFVKDVMTDPVDLAMVKAINDMAHALGKQTIAEFVEDEAILQRLIELGVDYAQGYGIAKPSPFTRRPNTPD